jgi:hypothetical protein
VRGGQHRALPAAHGRRRSWNASAWLLLVIGVKLMGDGIAGA